MENAPIQLTFSGLPGGEAYCLTTFQRLALDITAGISGFLPGQYTTFNNGPTEPNVDDRDKPWFNTNDGRLYFWEAGFWVYRHTIAANSPYRALWVGIEADLWSFDGGGGTNPTTNPPTDSTGAMWQVDADYAGFFPAFVGTIPGLSLTAVAVGGTGGSDQTTLAIANLPKHHHNFPLEQDGVSNQGFNWATREDGHEDPTFPSDGVTSDVGNDPATAVTNLPPYKGIYLIKRTARMNFVA